MAEENENIKENEIKEENPNMKIEKDIVLRRINLLKEEGITFIANTKVGVDITVDELYEKKNKTII